jgi:hypothetical protein
LGFAGAFLGDALVGINPPPAPCSFAIGFFGELLVAAYFAENQSPADLTVLHGISVQTIWFGIDLLERQ